MQLELNQKNWRNVSKRIWVCLCCCNTSQQGEESYTQQQWLNHLVCAYPRVNHSYGIKVTCSIVKMKCVVMVTQNTFPHMQHAAKAKTTLRQKVAERHTWCRGSALHQVNNSFQSTNESTSAPSSSSSSYCSCLFIIDKHQHLHCILPWREERMREANEQDGDVVKGEKMVRHHAERGHIKNKTKKGENTKNTKGTNWVLKFWSGTGLTLGQ